MQYGTVKLRRLLLLEKLDNVLQLLLMWFRLSLLAAPRNQHPGAGGRRWAHWSPRSTKTVTTCQGQMIQTVGLDTSVADC